MKLTDLFIFFHRTEDQVSQLAAQLTHYNDLHGTKKRLLLRNSIWFSHYNERLYQADCALPKYVWVCPGFEPEFPTGYLRECRVLVVKIGSERDLEAFSENFSISDCIHLEELIFHESLNFDDDEEFCTDIKTLRI